MLFDGPERCLPGCLRSHYCAITRLVYGDYRTCVESPASALPSSGAAAARAARLDLLVVVVAALAVAGS